MRSYRLVLWLNLLALLAPYPSLASPSTPTQTADQSLTIRSDTQTADQITGVVTAIGNVQINYPAQNIQATCAQAQYFRQEGEIVLIGNVYVLQNGNSLRGEEVTYWIAQDKFVAVPRPNEQVESIYLVNNNPPPEQPPSLPSQLNLPPLPPAATP